MKAKKNVLMMIAVIVMSIGIVIFIAGTESKTSQQFREGGDDGAPILNPSDTEQIRKLDITVFVPPAQFQLLKQLSEQLESKIPNLSIQLTNDPFYDEFSDKSLEQLKRSISLGEGSDILLVDNRFVTELASEGYLLPVDEIIQRDHHIPALVETISWNGSVWGMPWDADPYVLVWHPDGLQSSAYSSFPETLDELKTMEIFIDSNDPYAALALFNIWGGSLPELSAADVDWPDAQSVWTSLKKGEIAAFLTRISMLNNQLMQDGYKITPLQQLNDSESSVQEAGWIGGKSFVIPAVTKRKHESLDWIKQTASEEIVRSAVTFGFIPPSAEWIHSDDFEPHPLKEQVRQAFNFDMEAPFYWPQGSDLDTFSEMLKQFGAQQITAEALQSYYLDWLRKLSRSIK